MKTNKKAGRIAKLERESKELNAQLTFNYHFASYELDKFGTDRMMGSAVILELTVIGGGRKIEPIAILDGLSEETIKAIQADLARSYKLAVEFKPKGVE